MHLRLLKMKSCCLSSMFCNENSYSVIIDYANARHSSSLQLHVMEKKIRHPGPGTK